MSYQRGHRRDREVADAQVVLAQLGPDLITAHRLYGLFKDIDKSRPGLVQPETELGARRLYVSMMILTLNKVAEFFERYPVHVSPVVAGPPFLHGALQPPSSELAAMKVLGALRASTVMKAMGALERAAGTVFEWMSYTPVANATGQPAMSVPLSWNAAGLPIGVHFTARYADEATLLRLAAELEIAAPWREKRPRES